MTAAVRGVGWVTGAGAGMGRNRHYVAPTTGEVPRITRDLVLDESYPHFGRMDDLSRLGLAAIVAFVILVRRREWTLRLIDRIRRI